MGRQVLHDPETAAAADEVRFVQVAALDDDPLVATLERTFQRAVGMGKRRVDDCRNGDFFSCVVLEPDAFVRLRRMNGPDA